MGLAIEDWNAITWGGWSKRVLYDALWIADLTPRERLIFRGIRITGKTPQELAGHGKLKKYSSRGVMRVYLNAASKVAKGFELATGLPVSLQVFRCWLEDVYGRTVYRAPSHAQQTRTRWRPKLAAR